MRQIAGSLLDLHPSFWRSKTFIRWQALRRNEHYRKWANECFWSNSDFFLGKPFFQRYFDDYSPESSQPFLQWEYQAIAKARPRRLKSPDDIRLEVAAKKVVWDSGLPECLPDRWLPVLPEIEFPYPGLLSLLSKTTVGLAVSTVPFPDMKQIQVVGRSFWVDLEFSLREMTDEILSSNIKNTYVIRSEIRAQLADAIRHRPRSVTPARRRSRKRETESPRYACMFVAWELKQFDKSYRYIASVLWPTAFQKAQAKGPLGVLNKSQSYLQEALIKCAKEHVASADRLIAKAFS